MAIGPAAFPTNIPNIISIEAAAPMSENKYSFQIEAAAPLDQIENCFVIGPAALMEKLGTSLI